MKLNMEREQLVKGIQIAQGVITPKTTLPILSNMLMETQEGQLRLTATDLDIGISCVIPANIQETGAIAIPAKRFGDIIKELNAQEVNITVKKNNLVFIDAPYCQFKIMGLPAEEFPKLPEFKDKEVIKLEQDLLKKMLALTSFAVSIEETRYILNGILFEIKGERLTLVATDGKRLAIYETKLKQCMEKEIHIIVPVKTINELNRNLKDEGELLLILGNNQVLFDLGGVVIISRLLEGEFPDYRTVIPPESDNKVRLKREQFLWAAKRASLLSTPDYQAVKLEVFKNKLVVSKSTPDVGESREELAVEYQGKDMNIGFNPGYLIDVLKNLQDDSIVLELTDSEKPAVLRTGGYTYVILPMRLS